MCIRDRFRIPPPSITWSDFSRKVFNKVNFVDILAQDTIVQSGLLKFLTNFLALSISHIKRGPPE